MPPEKKKRSAVVDLQKSLDPLAGVMRRAFLQGQDPQGPADEAARRAAKKRSSKKRRQKKAKLEKQLPRSPLAPKQFPKVAPVPGVRLATAETGMKYKRRPDLLVADMAQGTKVAGVFTRTAIAAAPVRWCRSNLTAGKTPPQARVLVVNAGNANAFTGKVGEEAVERVAAAAIAASGARKREIFIASTGVIGAPLNPEPITRALDGCFKRARDDHWETAARAIMTTDTFAKASTRRVKIDDSAVAISGIAKGSGMIAPNMATMLAFIFTNADIPSDVLQTLLLVSVRDSFNAITVDGDTSTNDTVMLFATGTDVAHEPVTRAGDRRLAEFRRALDEVMQDLAKQIVRDGEGARKFIEVRVTGAANARAANEIARSIANSPLVKTAIAGEDANWGRVVMAVGKAGHKVDERKLSVSMGDQVIVKAGALHPDYDERAAGLYLRNKEIELGVDLGLGTGSARVWTCDLTRGYIDINAHYRS